MAIWAEQSSSQPPRIIEVADNDLKLDFVIACEILSTDGTTFKKGVLQIHPMIDQRRMVVFTKTPGGEEEQQVPIAFAGIYEVIEKETADLEEKPEKLILYKRYQISQQDELVYNEGDVPFGERIPLFIQSGDEDNLERDFNTTTPDDFKAFLYELELQIRWNLLSE